MHCLCAASLITPTFLVRIKTGFESNPSSHRIADLLQEDVVVAKSLVEDHHTSPRSALIKIVVKKEKPQVIQKRHGTCKNHTSAKSTILCILSSLGPIFHTISPLTHNLWPILLTFEHNRAFPRISWIIRDNPGQLCLWTLNRSKLSL